MLARFHGSCAFGGLHRSFDECRCCQHVSDECRWARSLCPLGDWLPGSALPGRILHPGLLYIIVADPFRCPAIQDVLHSPLGLRQGGWRGRPTTADARSKGGRVAARTCSISACGMFGDGRNFFCLALAIAGVSPCTDSSPGGGAVPCGEAGRPSSGATAQGTTGAARTSSLPAAEPAAPGQCPRP